MCSAGEDRALLDVSEILQKAATARNVSINAPTVVQKTFFSLFVGIFEMGYERRSRDKHIESEISSSGSTT